jgi:hypothetical protein
VVDNGQRDQKSHCRNSAYANQHHVDDPVQPLPCAAMGAFLKVLLIVDTHLTAQAGNVIPPAGKDVSNNVVRASGMESAPFPLSPHISVHR